MLKTFFLQVVALVIVSILGFMFYANPNWLNNVPFIGTGSSGSNIPNTPNQQAPNPQRLIIIDPASYPQTQTPIATLNTLEIADTPQKRALGLGGRDSLATDSGMLFLFDAPGKPQFWMKGMRIALDFIFIRNDQIVDILTNVAPPQPGQADDTLPRYSSKSDFDKLLEVNAGFVQSKGIKIGDKLLLTQ